MREEGSAEAAALWNTGHPAVSSLLFHPEGRAALAAAQRGRRLTARGHERSVAALEAIRLELTVIGIDEALSALAGELAAEEALRGYDAMHLATALSLGAGTTTLITWDSDLRDAAARRGLAVAPVR